MKQFQSFRLDTANHCLWSAENRVFLTPKAFEVLRYLLERLGMAHANALHEKTS